jgi:hypothetical protein
MIENPNIVRVRELLVVVNEAAARLQKSESPQVLETAGTIRDAVSELVGFLPSLEEPEPPVDPEPGELLQSETSCGGITYLFAEPVAVRRSITGEPVVPPGTVVVDVLPSADTQESGRHLNGSMLNPVPGQPRQGYDSRLFAQYSGGTYSNELNAARRFPLTLSDGDSLVSVESAAQPEQRPAVERAAVLTCGTPPVGPFLRPWATEGGCFYSWDDALARADEILSFRKLPDGFPGLGGLAADLQHLWLDHVDTWASRYLHPRTWMPDYGRSVADSLGIAVVAVFHDHPMREQLLAGLLQRAIDYAGWATNALAPTTSAQRYMGGAAGHNNGRKILVALAGLILGDEIGRAVLGSWSEEEQFFVVGEREIAQGEGYTSEHKGVPEWGTNPVRQPEKSERAWDADPYRQCCTMNALWGSAFALRVLPELRQYWYGHDAFLAYAERYDEVESELIAEGKAEPWQLAWSSWSKLALDLDLGARS